MEWVHRERLTASELALREADIEQQNLVSISSILPPGCVEMDRQNGPARCGPARSHLPSWRARRPTRPAAGCIPASAWRVPPIPSMYGYISEHHGYDMTRGQGGDYAVDLAASMLALTLGIEFDPDAAWNERKRVYETSNLFIDSRSITA
jgi:arginine decarboxylase